MAPIYPLPITGNGDGMGAPLSSDDIQYRRRRQDGRSHVSCAEMAAKRTWCAEDEGLPPGYPSPSRRRTPHPVGRRRGFGNFIDDAPAFAGCRRTSRPAYLGAQLAARVRPRSVAGHVRVAGGENLGHGAEPRCRGWRCRLPRGRLPDRGLEEFEWSLSGVVHPGAIGFIASRRAMMTNRSAAAAQGRTGRRPYLFSGRTYFIV